MPLTLFKNAKNKITEHPLASIGAIIAIAAGKGGVGKSTVSVNIALALLEQGYEVGILDADLYGPSIRKMLPESSIPIQRDNILYPALCKGIKLISMAYFRKEDQATAMRAPMANQFITHFIRNVHWGDLDFLFIDFPPGTGDIQLTLAQQAHLSGAVMVTTPQEVALLDVRKAISLFKQVKVPILGIIENMSFYEDKEKNERHFVFGQGGGQQLANENQCPFFGQIPIDPLICTCGDKGLSIFSEGSENRAIAQNFKEISLRLLKEVKGKEEKKKEEGIGNFELNWKKMGEFSE
jgi:ATP-binding protein involved in chromosome partitioning